MAPTNDARSRRISNRLIALSSAAVLTIYGAGFMRTRAAAARFDEESNTRQRPAAAPVRAVAPLSIGAAPSSATPANESDSSLITNAAGSIAPRRDDVVATTPPSSPQRDGSAPSVKTENVPPPNAPSTNAVENTAVAALVPPAAAPAEAAAPVSAPQPELPRTPAPPIYKDGKYVGWGTSRHGDIQATVTIAGGRIASAVITQCFTRYSCSVIDAIVPQVVQRQGIEVDYVSGATQSTNAFYYAVVEALDQARTN